MTTQTIDHSTLSRLVETGAVRDAHVVGQHGGWKIVVKADKDNTYTLTAQRKNEVRLFKKMDTLIGYLKGVGISRFAVDAAAFAPEPVTRPDRSVAMKQTHEAATHDKWFREQVEKGLRAADSPDAVWVSNEDARKDWASLRAELIARSNAGGERA